MSYVLHRVLQRNISQGGEHSLLDDAPLNTSNFLRCSIEGTASCTGGSAGGSHVVAGATDRAWARFEMEMTARQRGC
jgi:hypothetical protein